MLTKLTLAIIFICVGIHVILGQNASTTQQKSQDAKLLSSPDTCKKFNERNELLKIEFNVLNNEIVKKSPFKVRQDGQIEIYLEDVNLFLYNVSIKETQSNVVNNLILNELPADYSINLKNIDVSDLIFKDIHLILPTDEVRLTQEVLESDMALRDIDVKIQFKEAQIQEAKNEVEKIGKPNSISPTTENVQQVQPGQDTALQNLLGELKTMQDSLVSFKNQQLKQQQNKEQVLSNAKTIDRLRDFIARYDEYKIEVQKLYEAVMFYNDLICIAQSNGSNVDEILKNKNELAISYFGTSNAIEIMVLFKNIFPSIQLAFDKITKTYNLFNKNELKDNNVENAYKEISSFNNNLQSNKYVEVFQGIKSLYSSINPQNYKLNFSTNIIGDDADVIKYKITCSPKTQLDCSINPKTIEKNFEVRIIGGTKIDFSAGLFNNVALNDHSYRLLEITDSTVQVIENDQKNLFLPSLGGLIHVYRRGPKDFKIALSTGISITQEQKAAYYFGISALAGRSQRFVFSLGAAGKQVATATDNFKSGTIINKPIENIGSISFVTPSPFRVGLFFGLTFNLTSKSSYSEFTNYLTNQ